MSEKLCFHEINNIKTVYSQEEQEEEFTTLH